MAKQLSLDLNPSALDRLRVAFRLVHDQIDRAAQPVKRLGLAVGKTAGTFYKAKLAPLGEPAKKVGAGALAVGQRVAKGLSGASSGLGAFIREQADAGDAINDTAARLNIGTDALQELTYAFKSFGVEGDQVTSGLDTLNQKLGAAKTGMGAAASIFENLGIDPTQFATTNELLPVLADQLSSIRDPAQRAALANQLFGDSGARMIGLLGKGAAELESWRKKARDAGAVIGDDALGGASKFSDMLDMLGFTLKGAAGNALGQLYPALIKIGEAIQAAIIRYQPRIEAFAKQFAENLPRYFELAAAAAAGLFTALELVMNVVGWLTEKLGAGPTALIAFLTSIGGKLIGLAAAIGVVPTLIIAGIALVVAAVWWLYKNWDEVWIKISNLIDGTIQWIIDAFAVAWEKVKTTAISIFEGILDALKAMWEGSGFASLFRGIGNLIDRFGGAPGSGPSTAPPMGGQLLDSPAAQTGLVNVKIDLSNLPPNARTTATASAGVSLDFGRGYAMPGVY